MWWSSWRCKPPLPQASDRITCHILTCSQGDLPGATSISVTATWIGAGTCRPYDDGSVEHEDELKQADLYVSYFGTDKPERWGVKGLPFPTLRIRRSPMIAPFGTDRGCLASAQRRWSGHTSADRPGMKNVCANLPDTACGRAAEPLRRDEPASIQNWRHASVILADRQYFRLHSYLIKRKPDGRLVTPPWSFVFPRPNFGRTFAVTRRKSRLPAGEPKAGSWPFVS